MPAVHAAMQRLAHSKKAALKAGFEGTATALFAVFGGAAGAMGGDAAVGNGLLLAVLVYATATTSGGHLNPAVSLAVRLATPDFTNGMCACYIGAQILGAIVGAAIGSAIIPAGIGSPAPGCFIPEIGVGIGAVFVWEFMATFILVSTVLYAAVDNKHGGHGNAAPLAIGASLWATASVIGPVTGAALNPARYIAPLVAYPLSCAVPAVFSFYAYLGAHLLAAVLAAFAYRARDWVLEHDAGEDAIAGLRERLM